VLEKPTSVTEQKICWPLGTLATDVTNGLGNCQQKHLAWILNDTIAPTISKWPLLKTLWYNSAGERSSPSCDSFSLQKKQLAFWPLPLEPWINSDWRRYQRLSSSSPDCMFEAVEGLSISSVVDKSIYKRSSKGLSLLLQNTGGIGVITWY